VTQTAERREVGRWGTPLTAGGPTWVRVAVIAAVLVVAFVAAQTCQKSSIRLDKTQAIAKAERQVDFTPKRAQIRLLRQGLTSKPYWIVSLSRPGKTKGTFSKLAVIRINANTGKVETVIRER
jgi:hypothetical protein